MKADYIFRCMPNMNSIDLLMRCKSSGEQFFKIYHRHCTEPDADTLFNLLNSIHSLNDILQRATKNNFYECNEFISLNAFRNLFHHEPKLIIEVRSISAASLPSINSELPFLCLVSRYLILFLFEQLDKEKRVKQEAIIRSTLKGYRNVVRNA